MTEVILPTRAERCQKHKKLRQKLLKTQKHCEEHKNIKRRRQTTGKTSMSFSQSVKEEILKNLKKIKGCCIAPFLTAVLRSIGSLSRDDFGYSLCVESDNGAFLEFCARIAEQQFGVDSAFYEIRSDGNSPDVKFMYRFDAALGEKLCLICHDDEGNIRPVKSAPAKLGRECCRRAFMQGLFLSCGSVTVPESESAFAEGKGGYHLEMRFSDVDFADFVAKEFSEQDLRRVTRKKNTILYIKDSAKIADFFAYVDAVNARFRVENIIIERSFRNTANRQRNCIDSNIDKAVCTGLRQLAAIEKLKKSGSFDALPEPLKQVAAARENNPDATLQEIADILGISKSGANHRLRRLTEIAEEQPTQPKKD